MTIKDVTWLLVAVGAIWIGSIHWQRTNEIAYEEVSLRALIYLGIPSFGVQSPGYYAPEHDRQDLSADRGASVLD